MTARPLHRCGHPVPSAFGGRKAAQADCWECQLLAANVSAAAQGLPELRGTDRQIDYATIVRQGVLERVQDLVDAWDSLPQGYRNVMDKPAVTALTHLGHRLSPAARAELDQLAAEDLEVERLAVAGAMARLRAVALASWWLEVRKWPADRIVAAISES